MARGSETQHNSSFDYVYHLTLDSRLACLDEGLNPNPGRGNTQEWKEKEVLIDKSRPKNIRALGISRASSVFAHPEKAVAEGIINKLTGPNHEASQHLVSIEIEVNPDEVIVCDAFSMSFMHGAIKNGKKYKFSRETKKQAVEYWTRAMSLSQYRDSYRICVDESGLECVKRDGAADNLPYVLLQPEVLIPGPIPAERIKWHSSSVYPAASYVRW
ncbi:MAG TPA: hypothetical protein VFP32_00355 [Candidatus Saccharimonadales bacterium]|nr:hypothetical protein [Candidatus Saccharimonadales bacterium]